MEWYLTLTINMKINVKGCLMQLLTGIEFKDLASIFSFKERIDII